MIAAVVRTLLLSFVPVTTLVGQRVYTLILPQSPTLPSVRVQQIGEVETLHLRGPVNLYRARVQVDAVGASLASAEAVDAAARGNGVGTGLRAYRGSVGATRIDLIQPADVRTGYDASELRQFKVMRDYFVTYAVMS